MFPPIDPGSVAIGLLSGLLGWAIFLLILLPRFGSNLRATVKQDIKDELPQLIEDIAPTIKDAFKDEMPDFEELKKEFKAELPSIESASDEVITLLLAKLGDKDDEEIKAVFTIISARVVLGVMGIAQNDGEFKQWMGGMISYYGGGLVERLENMVKPLVKLAESYGVDLDNPEGGIDINKIKDNINIEDRLKGKFAMAADKALDNWIENIGKKIK